MLDKSRRKPNIIWVDKGSTFYNRLMKLWLPGTGIEMYSTHNERTSGVAEGFIRALRNKIYKYMASVSKSVYIDKLDDIFDPKTAGGQFDPSPLWFFKKCIF